MKVLYLGPGCGRLTGFLRRSDEVEEVSEKLTCAQIAEKSPDFIISYGYRYIIGEQTIRDYAGRIINLHVSFLPYNRGADPNFWSFFDNTPKGVTIHHMDEKLDTGDILLQKAVEFAGGETLKTSYEKLQLEIQDLLMDNWENLKHGRVAARKQRGKGTYHRLADKEPHMHLLTDGWDTPVSQIAAHGGKE